MRLRVLAGMQSVEPSRMETLVDETPSGVVWRRETRYPNIMRVLEQHGVRSCCVDADHRATPPGSCRFTSAQCDQQQLARERDRLQVVLAVTNAMVSSLDLRSCSGPFPSRCGGTSATNSPAWQG